MLGSDPISTFNSKNRPKKIRANFPLKRFFYEKGIQSNRTQEINAKEFKIGIRSRRKGTQECFEKSRSYCSKP
jgi:hypothetical protein